MSAKGRVAVPGRLERAPNHRAFAAFVLFVLLTPGVVAAEPDFEESSEETSSTEEGSSGEVVITEKAREHFKAGVNLLQDPAGARYDEAYQQFKSAYAESPSWKILGNLGLAAMNLERYGEAIDAFSEYLKGGQGTLTEEDRQQFQRDLYTLQASHATLTVEAPGGSEITDTRSDNRGAEVRNFFLVPESGSLTLRVRPGRHVVTVSSNDEPLDTWSVLIEAQGVESRTFVKQDAAGGPKGPPAATASSSEHAAPSRVPAYIALGVGAVGVGVGTAFLLVRGGHKTKATEQFDACDESGDCGTTERSSIEDGDKKAASAGTISMISFGVGVVGIGAGVALLLLGGSADKPLEADVGGVTLSPVFGSSQWGVTGTF